MHNPTIALINQSTVLTDAHVEEACRAFRRQLSHDLKVSPWGETANLRFYGASSKIPAAAWQCVILDDTDQAGALGYHDLTASGQPLAKVFARTDQQAGLSWTVTASHELLETTIDALINDFKLLQDRYGRLVAFAVEVGDPVEADDLGYEIDGVKLSNFVFPAWFTPGQPGPYDWLGRCNQPLQILPGGYQLVLEIGSAQWQSLYAAEMSAHPTGVRHASLADSPRRAARIKGRDHLIRSDR